MSSTARIGWIGIGRMGYAMAERLAKAGADLTVWNRTRSKAEPLAAHGAKIAQSLPELAACEVVFCMVSTWDDVKEVVAGSGGLLSDPARAPKLLIECSSISLEGSAELRSLLGKRGVELLAAPVSGNAKVIKAGRLSFVCSGPKSAYDRALPYLKMMTQMTGPSGLIPEQVWDAPSLAERGLEMGKPTGSAMPLVWAHAEFLKLLCSRQKKQPVELLKCVEEHYRSESAKRGPWRWRRDTPFDALPADRDLLVEMPTPFMLHLGFDGWEAIEDRPSSPLPFGMHGVRLTKGELAHRQVLDFTCYLVEEAQWEGMDHHVRVATTEKSETLQKLRTMITAEAQ